MLTLYTTPVIYLYMERLGRFLSRNKGQPDQGEKTPSHRPAAEAT
jgi:hypothetical protein